jgi:type II secretory pathway component PulM
MATNHFSSLSNRDRLFVVVGGIFVALMLFYFFFWSPLSARNEELVSDNAQSRELIDWMKKAKVQLIQYHQQQKNKATSNVSLLSAIEQSVKRNRLDTLASDIKQVDKNSVSVSFAEVSYLAVMKWIEDVQTTALTKIDKVSIQKTPKPGLVHVEITLLR